MEHQQGIDNEQNEEQEEKKTETESEASKRFFAAQADLMEMEAESKSNYFNLRKILFGV